MRSLPPGTSITGTGCSSTGRQKNRIPSLSAVHPAPIIGTPRGGEERPNDLEVHRKTVQSREGAKCTDNRYITVYHSLPASGSLMKEYHGQGSRKYALSSDPSGLPRIWVAQISGAALTSLGSATEGGLM